MFLKSTARIYPKMNHVSVGQNEKPPESFDSEGLSGSGGALQHMEPPGSEPGWYFLGRHDSRFSVLLTLSVAGQVAARASRTPAQ
jgi:hypothetical protein